MERVTVKFEDYNRYRDRWRKLNCQYRQPRRPVSTDH